MRCDRKKERQENEKPDYQELGLVIYPLAPSEIELGNCAFAKRLSGKSRLLVAAALSSTAAPLTGFLEGTYTVTCLLGNRVLTMLTAGTRSESPLTKIACSYISW